MDSALGMKGPAQLWKSKWWCIRLATAATPNGTQQFVHVLVLYACLKMAAHAPNTMNGVLGDVLLDQDSLRGNLVTSKRSSIRFRSDEPEDYRWHRFLHPPGTACTLSPHVVHQEEPRTHCTSAIPDGSQGAAAWPVQACASIADWPPNTHAERSYRHNVLHESVPRLSRVLRVNLLSFLRNSGHLLWTCHCWYSTANGAP